MKIAVVGVGYVGLVTSACFAKLGNDVVGIDNDREKIRKLKEGEIPIYEPGLEELVKEGMNNKRLSFAEDIEEGMHGAEVIFICVGTPPKENGDADLSSVETVCRRIAEEAKNYKLVVEKSTVPVNTGEWLKYTLNLYNRSGADFDVASNPEFLREGTAIQDFMKPDRIVIGVETERAKKILLSLYMPIDAPKLVTNVKAAELIKHASNAFLATKLSYINALSQLCEKVGADVKQVADGIGYDKRIGRAFLDAGPGFGGFCLPKDLTAFIAIAEKAGYDFKLLKAVNEINEDQKQNIVKKIEEAVWNVEGKTIGVLGLAFKPNTDDVRFSPAIEIANKLHELGAKIKAYDPEAEEKAKQVAPHFHYCDDAYEAAEGSNALVVLTDWDEFKKLDLERLKRKLKAPIVVDARNIYDPKQMEELGFVYKGVGRG